MLLGLIDAEDTDLAALDPQVDHVPASDAERITDRGRERYNQRPAGPHHLDTSYHHDISYTHPRGGV